MASPYDDFRKNWLKFGGTGGATGTYTDPNNTAIYSDENLPSIGGIPIWKLQRQFPAMPESSTFNPNTLGQSTKDTPPPPPGMMNKIGTWMGDHPMDAAKIGLGIWGGIQKQQAMGQQQQYLDDVRAAMAFDQADVDRRWNLAMGDYRVREEDQNQFRASQGMENKKSNFTV
tara:strand:- start:16348 stop:16863 length:516 start_codon:yes stop_codon:yes gene_type:complete